MAPICPDTSLTRLSGISLAFNFLTGFGRNPGSTECGPSVALRPCDTLWRNGTVCESMHRKNEPRHEERLERSRLYSMGAAANRCSSCILGLSGRLPDVQRDSVTALR